MKKIFSLIVLLAGVITFTSCSDDDATYTPVTPLEVSSADVYFEALGGTGSIVVNTNGAVTAQTSSQWLTVSTSGNTVTVTAQENSTRDGRSAKIVLTAANGATANVTATQNGIVYGLKKGTSYTLNDNANTLNLEIYHSKSVTVRSLTDWITASFNEETDRIDISVTPNNTGQKRFGYVEVSSGEFSDIVTISQFDFAKDVLGEYYLFFTQEYDSDEYYVVTATLTSRSLDFRLYTNYPWSIPVTCNAANSTVTMTSGAYLGRYSSYYIYLIFMAMSEGYWSAYQTNQTMTATIDAVEDKNGNVITSGIFEGVLSTTGTPFDGWNFQAMSSQTFASTASLGYLKRIYHVELEKIPAAANRASGQPMKYNAKPFVPEEQPMIFRTDE